ncbi:hypothetical protein LEN26_014239 [Aphanomyces euteiches]|nr:hypothetical protein LEN26_014239 [Aphanomyces euteiches]KAH9114617.1 hypothetical protein AeMF1_011304 [Aphanomyces euteiches]KAH9186159.1 hypothetical protein AeNC1_011869 [Aphanomyces euteiches]
MAHQQRGLTVRMNLRYTVPKPSSMCDLFDLLHSPVWVSFISNHMVPYLKHSTPADPAVLRNFKQVRSKKTRSTLGNCVICMGSLAESAMRVHCGHHFHADCIGSWLKLRSTCPTCRYQFPKEICGSYALRGINTALVLPPDASEDDLMQMDLHGRTLRTIVHVTLVEVTAPLVPGVKFACELNAVLVADPEIPRPEKRKLGEINLEITQKLKALRAERHATSTASTPSAN